MRFSRLAIACSLMGLAAGCAPSPYVPVERAMPVERANIPAEWIDPVTHKVSVPIGWNADYKVPADYVPKPGLSGADWKTFIPYGLMPTAPSGTGTTKTPTIALSSSSW